MNEVAISNQNQVCIIKGDNLSFSVLIEFTFWFALKPEIEEDNIRASFIVKLKSKTGV